MTLTLEKCEELMVSARDRDKGKPVANNTRLYRCNVDDCYELVLHSTAVVKLYDNGSVELGSGGWRTVTTKARINEFGPVMVWSDKGVWYCAYKGARNEGEVPFFDGIMFDADGQCINGPTPEEWREFLSRRNKSRKAVKKYIDDYIAALKKGMPLPGPGDCLYCQQGIDRRDHLALHIEESYYVPSLAVVALKAKGYGPTMIHYELRPDGVAEIMGGPRGQYTVLRRAMREYMNKRLEPQWPVAS